ncbi:hypothetical protein EDB81DRAFT_923750 [Dactylonectria macrodidyma]|uniref:Uncharacterized protein n=1 Tax=Dactylonectria macrodidyma TaxID=307937 RepID=A0A9P9JGJ8_9HYPO|nr:hypothetical protein EDB81DRAFT_923750 [Dactylonectria macrodidyma]
MQHHQADYDATFWIQASKEASINRDFLAIHRLLPETTPLPFDPTPKAVLQAVLMWFARDSGKYLMTFDEAGHLQETHKDYVDISKYSPRSSSLHIIITSRLSIVNSLSTFEGVRVSELDETQSIDHIVVQKFRHHGRTQGLRLR